MFAALGSHPNWLGFVREQDDTKPLQRDNAEASGDFAQVSKPKILSVSTRGRKHALPEQVMHLWLDEPAKSPSCGLCTYATREFGSADHSGECSMNDTC